MRLLQGNVSDLLNDHGGWLVGSFIDKKALNTKSATKPEVKWSERKSGETHQSIKTIDKNDTSSSFIILLSGEVVQTMGSKTYTLKNKGDYLFYCPNQPHKVEFVKDSVLITIRWYKDI
jgi:hypothetical protein